MSNLIPLFIVNVALVVVVHAILPDSEFGPQIQALQENVHNTCVSKSGTDEATINNVKQGIFSDEPKIKRYMVCVFRETKVLDENDVFNGQIIAQLLPDQHKEDGLTVINGCISKTSDIANLEDRIFNFFRCYHSENSDVFIFF